MDRIVGNCTNPIMNIWKGKRKKLPEELISQTSDLKGVVDDDIRGIIEKNYEEDIISFRLKYLGSSYPNHCEKNKNSDVVKLILRNVQRNEKKVLPVVMLISSNYIQITDLKKNEILKFPIWRISNCCIHSTYPDIFFFNATDKILNRHCHGFACKKIRVAKTATLAISHVLDKAYENLMNSIYTNNFLQEKKTGINTHVSVENLKSNMTKQISEEKLIDLDCDGSIEYFETLGLSRDSTDTSVDCKTDWVLFEE